MKLVINALPALANVNGLYNVRVKEVNYDHAITK